MITVVRAGPLTTVQDLGRPGYAHLGVPRSGALDPAAARLANAHVGNPESAAVLETTLMGCALRFSEPARVAVTGASAVVSVDGSVLSDVVRVDGPAVLGVVDIPAGSVLDVGRATTGVRSYVAVAGGIDVQPVLGSRSTDTLSGLGPARLVDGMTLPTGPAPDPIPPSARSSSEHLPESGRGDRTLVLGVRLGPRDDWFEARELFGSAYTISPVSNRVGARLAGPALTRTKTGELPPEGVVLGAVQLPADGLPLIFLADHPTTGGYPVVGVVDDVTPLAQARPGTTVRFRELD
jgi:biotin-dependent carboxylase-like uncharacterized protein